VFGDDRVIHYTGADDVTGGVGEAQSQSGAGVGKRFMEFYFFMNFKDFVNIYFIRLGNL